MDSETRRVRPSIFVGSCFFFAAAPEKEFPYPWSLPRGLKPRHYFAFSGTAKAVPLQNRLSRPGGGRGTATALTSAADFRRSASGETSSACVRGGRRAYGSESPAT